MRVINALADQFDAPNAIAVSGGHIWVCNGGSPFALNGNGPSDGSVTEFNESDGSLVRVIHAKADKFNTADGLTVGDGHVWVANSGASGNRASSITELNAFDGSLIRIVNAKADGLNLTSGIAFSNGDIWANNAGSLTEIAASDGVLVRVIRTNSFLGDASESGHHLWLVNQYQNSTTEYNTLSGQLIRTIDSRQGDFSNPSSVVVGGTHIWVINAGTPSDGHHASVSELDSNDGSLVRTIR